MRCVDGCLSAANHPYGLVVTGDRAGAHVAEVRRDRSHLGTGHGEWFVGVNVEAECLDHLVCRESLRLAVRRASTDHHRVAGFVDALNLVAEEGTDTDLLADLV